MLFLCTPGQLVNHLQATLAVNTEIPLASLWAAASKHCVNPQLSGFQKNIIWRAILTTPGEPLVDIYARNQHLPFDRELTFGALLAIADETEITLRPSEPCQFRYLTNTPDYAMLKQSLGEHPFALLVVIARHGEKGILNADLAREANQDIRSLRLRLLKLEHAGLVVCRSVYVNKKHTTCSVHMKFVTESTTSDHTDNSLEATRDVRRLRALVVSALRVAPNNLRGFSDLRKELRLDALRLASKFFRSVCLKMHRQGAIEKLHVELPATRQRVYAIRLVNPEDNGHSDDGLLPEIDEPDGFDDSDAEAEDEIDAFHAPVLNRVFPLFHQMFQQVSSSGTRGMTAGEVSKCLVGTADYRPFARLFELLPSYLSNLKNLKPFKKYAEPYTDYSLAKLYENEGKLRFYKYFALPFCSEDYPPSRPYSFSAKNSSNLLVALQKKLHVAASKISNESLRAKKRRLTSTAGTELLPSPLKRVRRTEERHNSSLPEPIGEAMLALNNKSHKEPRLDPQMVNMDSQLELALESSVLEDLNEIGRSLEETERPRRRRAAPRSFVLMDAMDIGEESGDNYSPKSEDDGDTVRLNEAEPLEDDAISQKKQLRVPAKLEQQVPHRLIVQPKNQPLTASGQTAIKPARNERRKRHQHTATQTQGSLKAISRRDHILDIIREEGGATFKSASLCRKLDERLGLATKTDGKTLSRDISYLTETGVLDAQMVWVDFEGRRVEKRVLVFRDPTQRPTTEAMEKLKASYVEHMSKKNMRIFEKRLIQSDMKLYVETPNLESVSSVTRKRRGKGRLATLDEGEYTEPEELKEDGNKELAQKKPHGKKKEDLDILERIKRAKRPRKAVAASTPTYGPRRTRRSIKLERSGATIVYRSVVISKAFSKDAIDFDAIALLLGDIDGNLLRQKWGTLRRLFGGANAVSKGVETFQNMVLQGVEDGHIMEEDLLEGDLQFFLNFWTRFDKTTEFAVPDEMPLYSTYEKNTEEYLFKQGIVEGSSSLAEKLEYQSMRQKEFVLGQQIFSVEANPTPDSKPEDEIKSILKSIFTTGDGNFDPITVKTVLGRFGDDAVRYATNVALREKEIQYLAFEDSQKFVLGDQFKSALLNRQLNSKLFQQAAMFKETLCDISTVGKGLILSQGIQSGEVACLLELISEGLVDMTRIDRTFKFENYESRLVDKQQIGCDIVVQVETEMTKLMKPARAKVPVIAACRPLWVDLNAEINKDLWVKIIISLLAHVVFRPGISDFLLQEKMQAVLSYADFSIVMSWLIESECVQRTASGGFMVTRCWSYVLGL